MKVHPFGTKEAEGDLDGLLVLVGVRERDAVGDLLGAADKELVNEGVGEGLLVVPHAAEDSILLQ